MINTFWRFQTKHAKLIQALQQARAISDCFKGLVILGETGVGRRLFAEQVNDILCDNNRQTQARIVRFSLDDLNKTLSNCTILLQDIDSYSVVEHKSILNFLARNKIGNNYIATASVHFPTYIVKGLLPNEYLKYFCETISIPSLNERYIDIPLLVENILETQSWILGRPLRVTNEAMEVLTNYNYKGNITELERILEKASIRSNSSLIDVLDLDLRSSTQLLKEISTLAEMERLLIIQALGLTGNNKTKAAKKLGISIRTLRNKLSYYHAHNQAHNQAHNHDHNQAHYHEEEANP